ncbi:MAG: hypothetical protein AAF518_10685 [Spirochaetota bacterium]
MIKKKYSFFTTIAVVSLLMNCATIIKGSRQKITITAAPEVDNAEVVIKDMESGGITIAKGSVPYQTSLKTGSGYFSGASYKVQVTAPGYKKAEGIIDTEIRWGWYLGGNLIFGGLLGYLVVDPATGAMWSLDPNEDYFNLNLRKSAATTSSVDSNDLNFVVILKKDMPKEFEGKLKRIN